MKECPPGKILNPTPNRCVDAKGALGKELAKEKVPTPALAKDKTPGFVGKEAKKDCPPGKIMNPKTNRCVDANGKLGKELASELNKINKVKTPEQKDIYDIINETGDLIKKQIDPFDKLKLNMVGMKHIKFTDTLPTYAPYFLNLDPMESDERNYGKHSAPYKLTYINGTYKDHTFAISRYELNNYKKIYITYNLLLHKSNVYVTLYNLKKSLKGEACECNVYYDLEKASEKKEIVSALNEFANYVFGVQLKLSPKYQQIFKPLNYEDDLVKDTYKPYTKPVPPIAKYGDQESGLNDPFYVSNIYENILYVFWCNRPEEYNSLKGYTPNAIFVVERKLIKKNYKYDNFLRLDFPSWGRLKENDRFNEMNIEELIKEIRNIIISVPFLAKFRGMSPYPRIIVE